MALEPIVPGTGGYSAGYSTNPAAPGITIPIEQSSSASSLGGSLGGNLLSSGINFFSARDTNRKAKKLAREQMRFQERMSNTAYQRAVKDMRAAGINPMLAYMKGGASTPGGAQPSLKTPGVDPTGVATAKNVQSQINQRELQNENLQAQNELIRAQTSSAQGLAKQTNVTGNWYAKHPELAPALAQGSGFGAAATGAKSLMNILKGAR